MPLPSLIVVSGPPGAGKTTLAHAIATALGCPAICRDEIKEGMVHATPGYRPGPGDALARRTLSAFFDTVRLLASRGVTVVAEAAFQDHVWRPGLETLDGLADLRIIHCTVPEPVARARITARTGRGAHADATAVPVSAFVALSLPVPTLTVDTTDGYDPVLADIVAFAAHRADPAADLDADLSSMALHDITETLGEPGLLERLDIEVARLPADEQPRVREALRWAAELHRDDRRTREPYVNHLLRVTIRIVHHYRITDPDVLCAALLHDAVEDHAADIAGSTVEALAVVRERFGDRVARLVEAVTNPAYDPDGDAHQQYRDHVRESLDADPWARVIKLSDFTDNAVGINWAAPTKARKVAPKYFPLVNDLRELAARPDTPLDDDVKRAIDAQLALGERRLGDLIGPPA